MKKTLVLLSMAAPAFAGVAPLAPAPIIPAPTPCPISVEVGVGYNWAGKDLLKHSVGSEKEIDTMGVDVTGVYALDENNSVNLRLGYAFGDESEKSVREYGWDKHETDMHVFTLMPGYRYTHALTDSLSVYAGANVGLAIVSVKDHWRHSQGGDPDSIQGGHDSEAAFAYSIEVGVSQKVTETISVFAAYQFAGNTADLELSDSYGHYADTASQTTHGVRCGVSIKF